MRKGPLRDDERRAWLRLARTETIGPATFAALTARFHDVREALDAAPRLARRGGAQELRMPNEDEAQAEIETLARLGGRLIASVEPDFPSGLAALDPTAPADLGARRCCAFQQGREVFAVPGSPLDPRAKGANRLIREGAALTEGAEDVFAALRPILGQAFREPAEHAATPPPVDQAVVESEADRVRLQVEEKLGPSPVDVDELIRQCGAPPAAILTVLLELELAGRVQKQPGNRVSWR
jgi:predicted Rossmann fold nucleotide-binding protein DprA/Smf involved in DNA uptake